MWADQPIREWIDAVCRQYSRVMGRALTFDAQLGATPCVAGHPGLDANEQWRTPISDGTQTVGMLRLKCRAGCGRDAEFLQACEAAELTAHLIERVVATRAEEGLGACDSRPTRPLLPPDLREDDAGSAHERSEPADIATRVERLLDMARRWTTFPTAALFVRDAETGALRPQFLRTPDVLPFAPESLIDCQAAVDASCAGDQLTVFRRNADPPGDLSFLPAEVATAAVQRLGDAARPQGALWLFDRRHRRLNYRDRHVLGSIAARLEPLLKHAALLDESSQSRRFKVEMKVASRTQPSLPVQDRGRDGWYELAGCMQSVRGIGGDLFELVPLSQDRLFVAIGDAAGHSIPAAMVMANVRGALRTLFDRAPQTDDLPMGDSPEQVLTRINSVLHGIVQSHQFMTMFCGILDGRTLTLDYANAGHPQPLLLRNGQVSRLEAHGLVLGVTDDAAYDRATISLEAGDVLAFYTDGVTEALSSKRQQFGMPGLENTLVRHAGDSAAAIRDELWTAVQQHVAGSRHDDDRTLAILSVAAPCEANTSRS